MSSISSATMRTTCPKGKVLAWLGLPWDPVPLILAQAAASKKAWSPIHHQGALEHGTPIIDAGGVRSDCIQSVLGRKSKRVLPPHVRGSQRCDGMLSKRA